MSDDNDNDDSKKTAEDYKELGNKAFAQKDYETAIGHYTKAIQSSSNTAATPVPNRHLFFSNRSASYAGLKQWTNAIDDAKECIRLDPQFIKGYYRLATAQLEAKDFIGAESTIKQGLSLDADNTQLLKVLRSIKLHKKAAEEAKRTASSMTQQQQNQYPSSSSSSFLPSGGGGRILDAATSQELQDLQRQHATTVREYNLVQANLQKAIREDKMYNLTLKELQDNPAKGNSNGVEKKNDDNTAEEGGGEGNYYRSVGKIFLKSTQQNIVDHLNKNIDLHQKKQKDHHGKLEYLEKRLKSQQMNMNELTGQAKATAAKNTDSAIPTTG